MARSRWSIRNAVPLVPAGNVRMLDAIEARLAQGRGSSGLAAYLRRAGVEYLVVRNDLARLPDIPDPVLVHQALAGSPGLERVASFGPKVGGDANLTRRGERILVNGGWQSSYPAVEVYRGAGSLVVRGSVRASGHGRRWAGGPAGPRRPRRARRPADRSGRRRTRGETRTSPLVLTDGLRAVERNFGRVHDGASATLVGRATPSARQHRTGLPAAGRRPVVHLGCAGGRRVSPRRPRPRTPRRLGSPSPANSRTPRSTAGPTRSGGPTSGTDEPAWWQLRLDRPRGLSSVRLTAGPDGRQVVRVRTGTAVTGPVVVEAGGSRTVALDGALTRTLRVEDDSGRVAQQNRARGSRRVRNSRDPRAAAASGAAGVGQS